MNQLIESTEENKNIEPTEDIREMAKNKGTKKGAILETDQNPTKDIIENGEVLYKAGHVVSFEKSDQKSLVRRLSSQAKSKLILEKFRSHYTNYIFNSKGFEGSIKEYIIQEEKITAKEYDVIINDKDIKDSLPTVMKKSTNRLS